MLLVFPFSLDHFKWFIIIISILDFKRGSCWTKGYCHVHVNIPFKTFTQKPVRNLPAGRLGLHTIHSSKSHLLKRATAAALENSNGDDFFNSMEEQLKAVEGRNRAMQSYIEALDKELVELERAKQDIQNLKTMKHTQTNGKSIILDDTHSSIPENPDNIIRPRTDVIDMKEKSTEESRMLDTTTPTERRRRISNTTSSNTIPSMREMYSNHSAVAIAYGIMGIITGLIGLRTAFTNRQEKQSELYRDEFSPNKSTLILTSSPIQPLSSSSSSSHYVHVWGIGSGGYSVLQQMRQILLNPKDTFHHNIFLLGVLVLPVKQPTQWNLDVNVPSSNITTDLQYDPNTIITIPIEVNKNSNSTNTTTLSIKEQIQQSIHNSTSDTGGMIQSLIKDAKIWIMTMEAADSFSSIVSATILQQVHRSNMNLPSICFISTPFPFEGSKRISRSKRTIESLTTLLSNERRRMMIIIFPSHVILETISKESPISKAYGMVDENITAGIIALIDFVQSNQNNSDSNISDENPFQKYNGCIGTMGIGRCRGENAITEATLAAIANPTLGGIAMEVSRVLLVTRSRRKMTNVDFDAMTKIVKECFDPSTDVLIRSILVETMTEDEILVVIFAFGKSE